MMPSLGRGSVIVSSLLMGHSSDRCQNAVHLAGQSMGEGLLLEL